jgi:hypothetical protein
MMPMSSTTNAKWTRIGDLPLGLGLARYEHSKETPGLWRFHITKHAGDKVIEVDAEVRNLREIIRFCELGIEILNSDGGRIAKDTPAEPEK